MKMYNYPICAGHEGIGEVASIGSRVTHLKVGQLVGLGVYRSCCGVCSKCAHGLTNVCDQKQLMFAGDAKGCFAETVRIDSKFAFPIPDGIPAESAGPLMCAGVTVFAPFRNHNIKPGDVVGVCGIGGLGHLALQIARAFGCEVYAFSTTSKKEEECKKFGAHYFINTSDEASKNSAIGKVNFLLMTASGPNVDYKYLMRTLAPNGTLILLGVTGMADIAVSPIELLFGQKKLCGSAAGSMACCLDMLKFCAHHQIRPKIETWPVKQINDAIAKVKSGDIRYRAVVIF